MVEGLNERRKKLGMDHLFHSQPVQGCVFCQQQGTRPEPFQGPVSRQRGEVKK